MNCKQLLIVELAVLMVVTGLMTMVKMETCSSRSRTSLLSLEITTWRNASGHRHVKTDIMFPRVQNGSKQANFEVKHYTSIETSLRETHLSSLLLVPEIVRGPPKYELMPGFGWYRLHLQPRTWEEARIACEDEGAHLAVLNSPEEADVLKTLFSRAPETIANASYSHSAHIGYSDVVEEGVFHTIFGETLEEAGYADWASTQPNNAAGVGDKESDCGAFHRIGKLNDIPCRALTAYFCEYPL